MNSRRYLFLLLFCLVIPAGQLPAGERPGVQVRPELYLGWTRQQKPPEPKKLPWMLQITLRAVDGAGRVAAGPLKVNTREEFAGAGYTKSDLVPLPTADTNETARAVAVLNGLEFAVQVVPEGANLINLRCFVKVQMAHGERVATYQTTGLLACRPGRETVLAEFPDLKLLLTAEWRSPVLVE